MGEIKVFISYSHDSDEHRQKVLALSERLRKDGIETFLDQYVNGAPEQGWPRWMLNQIDAANFVLVVCTETYYRRFRGHEELDKGKGVNWEGALITQELYHHRSKALKFVPVFLSAAVTDWIPEPLRAIGYYALTSENTYHELCDFLTGQAGVEPRLLGELRPRRRITGTPLAFDGQSPTILQGIFSLKRGAAYLGGAVFLVLMLFVVIKFLNTSTETRALWSKINIEMRQLNIDFIKDYQKKSIPADRKVERLKVTNDKHILVIEELKRVEAHLSDLKLPSNVVALYNYLALACYQQAAILKYQAENEKETVIAKSLANDAMNKAVICVQYADKGLEWNRAILGEGQIKLGDGRWSAKDYEISKEILLDPKERIGPDLVWYRTAGRSIQAAYGRIPIEDVIPEILQVRDMFDKDSPEDDATMEKILASRPKIKSDKEK